MEARTTTINRGIASTRRARIDIGGNVRRQMDKSSKSKKNSRQTRQPPTMTGTGAAEIDDIKAETKRAWLLVGRLKQDTTTEAVKRFLAKRET